HTSEYGWVIVLLVVLLYGLFRGIERHYRQLRDALSMEGYVPPVKQHSNTILILVPRIHRGIMPALEYGTSLTADVRAVHIETDVRYFVRPMRASRAPFAPDTPASIPADPRI